MRHAPWEDGELAPMLQRFPFFGASGEKLGGMQVQRHCRVLRGWMARAECRAQLCSGCLRTCRILQGWKGWLIEQELLLRIYQEALVCLHSHCQAAGALTHAHFLGFWEGKRIVALFCYSFFMWAGVSGHERKETGAREWTCASAFQFLG